MISLKTMVLSAETLEAMNVARKIRRRDIRRDINGTGICSRFCSKLQAHVLRTSVAERFMEREHLQKMDVSCGHEPWRSGVSEERRNSWKQQPAALCGDAATGVRFMESLKSRDRRRIRTMNLPKMVGRGVLTRDLAG